MHHEGDTASPTKAVLAEIHFSLKLKLMESVADFRGVTQDPFSETKVYTEFYEECLMLAIARLSLGSSPMMTY